MRLFLFECRKILLRKVNLIVLILFTLFSLFAYHALVNEKLNNLFQHEHRYEDGSRITRKDEINVRANTKQAWTGVMDKSWWSRIQKANKEAENRWNKHFIDYDKMEAAYGTDWFEDYYAHPNAYGYPEYDDMNGKREIYSLEKEPTYNKQDIVHETIMEIYQYGKTMLLKQPWNNEDGSDGFMISTFDNQKVPSPVYAYDVNKEEIAYLKQVMNSKDSFRYGDTKNLDVVFVAFSIMGILLMFWVILISGNIVNKERRRGMLETLSTCKRGKSVLFFSKLGAVIVCALLGAFIMSGSLLSYAALTNGIGDLSVNATESVNLISIVTYGEGLFHIVSMMILAVVIISVIGVLCSTFVSSSYISMALILVFCLLPSFGWMGRLHNLMPDAMLDAERAIRYFTMPLFDRVWNVTDICILVWCPLILLLSFTAWKKYTSKSYRRI